MCACTWESISLACDNGGHSYYFGTSLWSEKPMSNERAAGDPRGLGRSDWPKFSHLNLMTLHTSHIWQLHHVEFRGVTGSAATVRPVVLRRGDVSFWGREMASPSDRECSSSEEDRRSDLAEETMEKRRTMKKNRPQVTSYHPFSVEALMSGKKTHSHSREFTTGKTENGSVGIFPKGQNSPPYLCRETYNPPGGIRKQFVTVPPSPVKSETSESDECAPWVISPTFSSQPSKLPRWGNIVLNLLRSFT